MTMNFVRPAFLHPHVEMAAALAVALMKLRIYETPISRTAPRGGESTPASKTKQKEMISTYISGPLRRNLVHRLSPMSVLQPSLF